MNKACVVESCEKPVIARGCCPSHYNRMRRTGSPHPAPRRGVRTIEDRFWEKVEKTDTCWNWTAFRTEDGYGQMMYSTRDVRPAHRISWDLHNDAIPAGMEIDHACHNRACVNPGHLRLATRAENNQNLTGQRKNNVSGHRGVYWSKPHGKWRARVQIDKVYHELGLFDDVEEAASVARRKRREVFAYNHADQ